MTIAQSEELVLPPFKKGTTWRHVFYWIQKSNNQPVNLAGCVAELDIVHQRTQTVVFSDTSDSSPSCLTITPLDGIVTLEIPPSTNSDIATGTHKTDLKITFADGSVKTSETLILRVIDGITN